MGREVIGCRNVIYLPSEHTHGGVAASQSCKCECQVACAEMCIKQGAVTQRDQTQCSATTAHRITPCKANSSHHHVIGSKSFFSPFYVCVYMCACIYACMCACVYVCVFMHACMNVCVCVCVYLCVCVCVCVHVHKYTTATSDGTSIPKSHVLQISHISDTGR